jgi:hypothetical protein
MILDYIILSHEFLGKTFIVLALILLSQKKYQEEDIGDLKIFYKNRYDLIKEKIKKNFNL